MQIVRCSSETIHQPAAAVIPIQRPLTSTSTSSANGTSRSGLPSSGVTSRKRKRCGNQRGSKRKHLIGETCVVHCTLQANRNRILYLCKMLIIIVSKLFIVFLIEVVRPIRYRFINLHL